jgi:hypothetical protein
VEARKLRPLHWRKLKMNLRSEVGAPSVWASAAVLGQQLQLDRAALLALFSAKALDAARRARSRSSLSGASGAGGASGAEVSERESAAHPEEKLVERPKTALLSTKRAQHVLITMSRFKRAREPAAMQAACLALDAALLRPEDIAALLTCLPTAEEEEVLPAHTTSGPPTSPP